MNPSRREALARELEKAELVYRALVELGGRATIDEVARCAQMPREETYYIMTKLNERGFLVRERDESTLLLYFRVVRELKPEELLGIDVYIPPGEPDIYARARRVKALIDRHGFRADLIGACKVHLTAYPHHRRLTVDVDVVAASEDEAVELVKLLLQSMSLKPYGGWIIDFKLGFTDREGGIDVSSIGLKKSRNNILWRFWNYFKNYRGLLLEHTLVSKLMRPYFDPVTDGYDVLKSLVYSDVEMLVKLTGDAYAQAGEYALSIGDNLRMFLNYYELVKDNVKDKEGEELKRDLELAKKILDEYRRTSMRRLGFATALFERFSPNCHSRITI